jgi:hypothetical protein
MPHIASAEETLLQTFGGDEAAACAIFILGAPRTGSTVLYQAMVGGFGLPYISNFTNDFFPTAPAVGLAIQNGLQIDIGFESSFGKTIGAFQPSEGSAVMTNWFGGGHPSQVVSTGILDGREPHFLRTLVTTEAICGAPLLIKNAWHCFRVAYLARRLSRARFIWIRRDIRTAALSDLEARYITKKGDAGAWNSATPANAEELRQLPPVAQVVENQFEFNTAVAMALHRCAKDRWIGIWYEDLIAKPDETLNKISSLIGMPARPTTGAIDKLERSKRSLRDDEITGVHDYVAGRAAKFHDHQYPPPGGIL